MYTASINATQSAAAGAKHVSIEKQHPYLAAQVAKETKNKLLLLKAKKESAKNAKNNSQD